MSRNSTPKSANVFTVKHRISAEERARSSGHRGGILWFTGLSCAGKTTLGLELERRLFEKGYRTYMLDGDNVRQGLSADLDFSPGARTENIRRVGELAALFADSGLVVITAFISPYRADRDRARKASPDHFCEIYINAPLDVCEKRDTKGLYRRARAGEIAEFTGITAPYEPPIAPDLEVRTAEANMEACIEQLLHFVDRRFKL